MPLNLLRSNIIPNTAIVVILIITTMGCVAYYMKNQATESKYKKLQEEHGAVLKVSQEFGLIRISDDGKRYVSFAPRVHQNPKLGETAGFLEVLESLDKIQDLKGVSLQDLSLTGKSLETLQDIKTLEKVFIERTGISYEDSIKFKSLYKWNRNLIVGYEAPQSKGVKTGEN